MEEGAHARRGGGHADAFERGCYDTEAPYEPPRLTVLGSVADLTAGPVSGNSDFLSPGTALS